MNIFYYVYCCSSPTSTDTTATLPSSFSGTLTGRSIAVSAAAEGGWIRVEWNAHTSRTPPFSPCLSLSLLAPRTRLEMVTSDAAYKVGRRRNKGRLTGWDIYPVSLCHSRNHLCGGYGAVEDV
jgi:hypothetical protein